MVGTGIGDHWQYQRIAALEYKSEWQRLEIEGLKKTTAWMTPTINAVPERYDPKPPVAAPASAPPVFSGDKYAGDFFFMGAVSAAKAAKDNPQLSIRELYTNACHEAQRVTANIVYDTNYFAPHAFPESK